MARKSQKKRKSEQPEEEFLADFGPWGDLWRYFKLVVSLAFNFGFALFVGYVLGEMADDTFLGSYDEIFTHIGLGLGFIGALVGSHKRIVRFFKKQEELFRRRYTDEEPERYSRITLGIGFLTVFAGLCRLAGLIYFVELREAGALWLLWLDLILVGGGLLAVGTVVLLRRWRDLKLLRWVFLVPIATSVPLLLFSVTGGAQGNVAVAMMLTTLGPLVGMYLAFFASERRPRTT
ncbi:hypothetical protein KAU45_10215 [bacterium]|nr:hypothetical protein [bacterium]